MKKILNKLLQKLLPWERKQGKVLCVCLKCCFILSTESSPSRPRDKAGFTEKKE